MKRHILKHMIRLVLLSIFLALPPWLAAASQVTIEYEVWMAEPHSHYFDVAMTVAGIEQETIDLIMPVWTPGSYVIRDYARHVITLSAVDGSGRPLPVEKISKSAWRIHSNRAAKLIVRYRVYAFDDNMRENYLDESHAFIHGASLFMYVDGFLRHPVRLKLNPAPTWNMISTGLDPVPDEDRTYQAPDYDVLADCPIEIGRHQVYEFDARGIPHRIAIYGPGNYDPNRLMEDTRRIVEAAVTLFGDIPYKHYTFIVHLTPAGSDGLEHANSSALHFPRWGFEADYPVWLSLVAHELFHAWNVKRLRPKELGPFDYTRENYTRVLWVVEGVTDYYEDRLLRQAGLITENDFLQRLADDITELQNRPGRRVQSVAEASFDAWIKFYQSNENTLNTTVSYYTKGKILGALLDLEIRRRTDGTRSLDDVMRTLYRDFYQERDVGYSEAEFRHVCERIAGGDLSEFFDRYVYGTAELDYDRFFAVAGLRLAPIRRADDVADFGAGVQNQDGRVLVASVIAGSPAYQGGVYARDEIVAFDGQRVSFDDFLERLHAKKPGQSITLTIARQGILQTIAVVLGQNPMTEYRISPVDEPTAEQYSLYQGWVLAARARRPPARLNQVVQPAVEFVR